ncbi:MAG: VWA domain-containing protein [Ruminococcaceae bacterium]|nr:VWA domain-containing protein [Oscillospiraceae bacterium]
MKKFIKVFALMLALLLTFSFIACDASKADENANMGGDRVDNGYDGILNGGNGDNKGEGSIINGSTGSLGGIPDGSLGDNWNDEEAPDYSMPGDAEIEGGVDMEPEEEMKPSEPEVGDPTPPDGGDDAEKGETEVNTGVENETEVNTGVENETDHPCDVIVPENPFITKPFTNTSDNKYSTFSADVDTASYTFFRKLVNSGYAFSMLRGNSAFRTEEFINYFRYDVPQPAENELFGVVTEIAPCPWDENTMLFRVTLQAENVVNTKGNNLIFLIDVSGSMSSTDKLPLLQKAFSYLVGNLGPNDTVSIVTYSGHEAVVLDGCKGADTETIMNAINSLKASGSTNGEAGLTMAYQIAEKHFIEGGNNRIIMASDGDLNVGISSATELTKYIEEKRDQGIYLSVLGFGTGNYRDDRMEALADNGNGVYYYIDGESEAEKVFGTDLTGTLYTVANDVKLQVEFDPAYVEAYRLIGYDNRVLDKDDFEDDTKDAGEVGASHQVTVCYELKLKPNDSDGATYMTLRVRYKNPGEPISLLNEYTVGGQDIAVQPSEDTRFIGAVIELTALLRNLSYDGEISIEDVLEELDSLTLTDPYKLEFRELVRALVTRK